MGDVLLPAVAARAALLGAPLLHTWGCRQEATLGFS